MSIVLYMLCKQISVSADAPTVALIYYSQLNQLLLTHSAPVSPPVLF